MPQKARINTRETSKIRKMSCYWDEHTDKVSSGATHANKAAVKSIKRSAAALQRKGGTCLCGVHYKCHHSACLPMKKRKLCGEEILVAGVDGVLTCIGAGDDSGDDYATSGEEKEIGDDADYSPRVVPDTDDLC